jgi:Protein of unknown function (DUF1631)
MSEFNKPEVVKLDAKKVVQLNVERNSSQQSQIALARLPAAMHNLRDKARQQLQNLLRELFDKVDDAMFELADKADNNQDQNLYFDSMREVRIRRRAMETTFFRQIDIGFAQLLDANAYKDETIEEKQVSADELSLVKNDELEEMVATDGMINKANELYAEAIQHLTLRIDHLVPIKVYQKNNPLGADVICRAFVQATSTLTIDVKAKLVLFKLFDNLVMSQLGKLFDVLNRSLIDANILPSLKPAAKVKKNPVQQGNYVSGGGVANGINSGSSPAPVYDEQTNQVLQNLRSLLGHHNSAGMPQNQTSEIATQDLLRLLSQAQHKHDSAPSVGVHHAPVSLRQMLQELLTSETEKTTAINQVDDDVINLVSMMFEFILDDRNLASPMKALIGRLQIPMVKVAIADKSFFSKGGHPARRLLNEMAMACLGWQETSAENLHKDNLYNKMQELVRVILSDFETDMGIFNNLLLDFRAFQEKEKRRAQILEQRTIDAEDGKAKSERARAEVDTALRHIIGDKLLPQTVTRLLRDAWANVMFISCLKQGTDSEDWLEKNTTAQQLVWSVTSAMDKDNRQKLLRMVPELLQKLRTGLEGISFSPLETTQLFKQLEAVHLARLRSDTSVPADKPLAEKAPEIEKPLVEIKQPSSEAELEAKARELAEKNAQRRTAQVQPRKVESSVPAPVKSEVISQSIPELVETLAEPEVIAGNDSEKHPVEIDLAHIESQHLALVANITQGTWFEMQGDNGEKYRCRLAAIIRPAGKYIFVNRSGMKVAEESKETLALALQQKRLSILDDGMLFDRALEAVIGNLREKRPST